MPARQTRLRFRHAAIALLALAAAPPAALLADSRAAVSTSADEPLGPGQDFRHAAPLDLDTGDDEQQPVAAPAVTFGRALDLEGTPITLGQRGPRATGSRFAAGRVTGRAVMPSGTPVRRFSLTSGFGSRYHPVYGTTRFHAGIDMAAPYGTPVYATSPGVVLTAGSCGGYGLCVAIDHGGGVVSIYGHLSRVDVQSGAAIARGAELGLVGSTGVSTGPHLHYEIRQNGRPLNPAPYLY